MTCSFLPKVYEAKTTILISPPTFKFNSKKDQEGVLSTISYKELVMSSGILQSVVDQLEATFPKYKGLTNPEVLEKMILIKIPSTGNLKDHSRDANLMIFKVSGNDPLLIKEIADILTTLLAKESRKMRANEMKSILIYTKAQYLSAKTSLLKSEQALQKVKTKNNLPFARDELSRMKNNLSFYELDLALVNLKLNEELNILAILNEEKDRLSQLEETELLSARIDIKKIEANQKLLLESVDQLRQGIPQSKKEPVKDLLKKSNFILLADQIEKIRIAESKKTAFIQSELLPSKIKARVLTEKKKVLLESINQLKQEIPSLENNTVKMQLKEKQLARTIEALEYSFKDLAEKLEVVRIAEAEKTSDIRLISKAIKPLFPIWPDKNKIVLIAIAAGLAFGVAVTLAKEHLDHAR